MRTLHGSQPVLRLATAVLYVVLVTLIRLGLDRFIAPEETPFLFYFGAIMATGWRGGFGPGLVATVLSALAADIFFYTPGRLFYEHTSAETFWLMMFVLEGTLISVLCDLRLRSEEELRRFKLISDRANDALFVADTQGRLLYVNQIACQRLGYGREELLKMSVQDLGDMPDGGRYAQVFELARRGLVEPFEGSCRRKDGSEFPTEVSVNVVPFGGRACLFAAVRDISERKRADEELRTLNATLERRVASRTEQLEQQASQLRSLADELTQAEQRERRRIAEVLHDHLQQLLVAAKLRIAAAMAPGEEEDRRQVLQDLRKLLDDSITATRSLTAELRPPVLYEQGLIPALRWLGEWMSQQHGLRVSLNLDPRGEPRDERQRILLFQSTRELLFNVVKYASVGEATLGLDLDEPHGSLCLWVEDRGRGFDASMTAQRRVGPGGFGLFSIGERLKVLGGRLEIRSVPGLGTRVEMWAPRADAPPAIACAQGAGLSRETQPEQAATGALAPPTPNGRVRVLIVDDHQLVRHGISQLLKSEPGIEVVGQAADGQEALEKTRRLSPDVVLMDLNMPRMNGLVATRTIRQSMPGVCVIALSVQAESGTAQAMLEAGASAYLHKDEAPHRLVQTILGCTGDVTRGAAVAGRSL